MITRSLSEGQNRLRVAVVASFIGAMTSAIISPGAYAQTFDSGSDGSYGAINCTYQPIYECVVGEGGSDPTGPRTIPCTSNVCTLDMPPDGIFHCTTITVAAGEGPATLKFNKNRLNTPVYLLATGDISIIGAAIDVTGKDARGSPSNAGQGGPGGFDGGTPGFGSALPPGDGHGPGAGLGGSNLNYTEPSSAGAGSFGGPPRPNDVNAQDGLPYGSPLLVPLVGGSGGGGTTGTPGGGGGGGGGAILIASNSKVSMSSGTIRARGGFGVSPTYNNGSGGAIRIVAPTVSGTGTLDVRDQNDLAGPGRIRIDALDRSGASFNPNPSNVASAGSFMIVFPDRIPRLDIIEVAGMAIPEGTADPVLITLPLDSPTTQSVSVQAKSFSGILDLDLVVQPEQGPRTLYPLQIDMTQVAPGSPGQVTTDVEIPVNVPTRIYAWTR